MQSEHVVDEHAVDEHVVDEKENVDATTAASVQVDRACNTSWRGSTSQVALLVILILFLSLFPPHPYPYSPPYPCPYSYRSCNKYHGGGQHLR